MLYEELIDIKTLCYTMNQTRFLVFNQIPFFFLREREKERGGKDTHNYYAEKKL